MKYRFLIVFYFFSFFAANGFAQTDNDTFKKLLTGDDSKLWIFQDLLIRQSGQSCTGGDALEFYKNGKLKVIACSNGLVKVRQTTWTIENSGLDNYLVYDGNKVLMAIIKKKGDNKYLYLLLYTRKDTGERIPIKEYKYEDI